MVSVCINHLDSTFSNKDIAAAVTMLFLRRVSGLQAYQAIIKGGRFTIAGGYLEHLIIRLELSQGRQMDIDAVEDRMVRLPDRHAPPSDSEYLVIFCDKAGVEALRFYYTRPWNDTGLIRIAEDIWDYLSNGKLPQKL